MASEEEIHVLSSWNYKVQLTENGLPLDVSACTSIAAVAVLSNGARLDKTPTFITDGTDGWVNIAFTKTDIAVYGETKIQVVVEWGANRSYSSVGMVYVHRNI